MKLPQEEHSLLCENITLLLMVELRWIIQHIYYDTVAPPVGEMSEKGYTVGQSVTSH